MVFFIATIGNYDYAINWIFHQDGALEVDAALTGIMLPKGVKDATAAGHDGPPSGHLVAANVVAPHHQHFFNFRLDFDVDGAEQRRPRDEHARRLPPGQDNPMLNGMIMEETMLASEKRAPRRHGSWQSARTWLVINPSAQNALGHHTSYILVPGANCASLRRRRRRRCASAPASSTPVLGHALPRRRDVRRRRVSEPEHSAATDCRSGSPTMSR